MIPNQPKNTIIKDYSEQSYEPDDDEDFEVRGPKDEMLIDRLPGDDADEFANDMHNFGDENDLPDSDRTLSCRAKGTNSVICNDK